MDFLRRLERRQFSLVLPFLKTDEGMKYLFSTNWNGILYLLVHFHVPLELFKEVFCLRHERKSECLPRYIETIRETSSNIVKIFDAGQDVIKILDNGFVRSVFRERGVIDYVNAMFESGYDANYPGLIHENPEDNPSVFVATTIFAQGGVDHLRYFLSRGMSFEVRLPASACDIPKLRVLIQNKVDPWKYLDNLEPSNYPIHRIVLVDLMEQTRRCGRCPSPDELIRLFSDFVTPLDKRMDDLAPIQREEVLAMIERLEEAGNMMGLNELAGLLKLARKFELEKVRESVIGI